MNLNLVRSDGAYNQVEGQVQEDFILCNTLSLDVSIVFWDKVRSVTVHEKGEWNIGS